MSQEPAPPPPEAQAVAERYARRAHTVAPGRYSPLRPEVWQTLQERQRAWISLLAKAGWHDWSALRLTEVGCGAGNNLLEFLHLGVAPENLTGLELLPERCAEARRRLPAAVRLIEGDAQFAAVPPHSQDVVLAATVFSSLLDDDYQADLARAMWAWVKPGGGVLWYDFTVNNPRNADVRGVPVARVAALFPQARRATVRRLTLAPPLARAACRVHPALYGVFNALPLLRTHALVWLSKPG
jgi:SAM-dependent methyltransferase